jgi:hypothetical protein
MLICRLMLITQLTSNNIIHTTRIQYRRMRLKYKPLLRSRLFDGLLESLPLLAKHVDGPSLTRDCYMDLSLEIRADHIEMLTLFHRHACCVPLELCHTDASVDTIRSPLSSTSCSKGRIPGIKMNVLLPARQKRRED